MVVLPLYRVGDAELKKVFLYFDQDHSEMITFSEFVEAIRVV